MSGYNRQHSNGNGLWGGVIILCIGLFFLFRRLDIHMPDWLFSWEMLLIVIGFLMGVKRRFQGAAWFILILVGGFFIVDDIFPFSWHLDRFLWPTLLIVLGVYLIGRSASRRRQYDEYAREYITPEGLLNEDMLEATAIFGSNNKVILSKNFRGGNVTTIFGSTELNFMQADIQGEAVLDISTVFGGVELIIPGHWDLRMGVDTIFGGAEDKRMLTTPTDSGKVLVLKGTCVFGGVDIKSY